MPAPGEVGDLDAFQSREGAVDQGELVAAAAERTWRPIAGAPRAVPPASISPNIGTVCRLRTGCPYTVATIAECNRDISAVCGARVDPAYVCRQASAQCPHTFP